jgi:23S rRNA (cytosine1962-C5)-methyltransferase
VAILCPVAAFSHPSFPGYQLLDSGDGEKLERFGDLVLRRPDPQALWRPRLDRQAWRNADLSFVRESDRGGRWQSGGGGRAGGGKGGGGKAGPGTRRGPQPWEMDVFDARIDIRPTPFKHVGLFPEQSANWQWVGERLRDQSGSSSTKKTVLNLFGYTGVASILAAQAGADVTHVDASKSSITWASENAQLSGLSDRAIRWICDDAAAFAAREVRRGRKYTGILLDPPHYGRGPKGEKWQFEQHIAPLLDACRQLLDPDQPSWLILSTYAIGYSPIAFENMLREFGSGEVETGELALPEDASGWRGAGGVEQASGRLLPCGFCARYLQS